MCGQTEKSLLVRCHGGRVVCTRVPVVGNGCVVCCRNRQADTCKQFTHVYAPLRDRLHTQQIILCCRVYTARVCVLCAREHQYGDTSPITNTSYCCTNSSLFFFFLSSSQKYFGIKKQATAGKQRSKEEIIMLSHHSHVDDVFQRERIKLVPHECLVPHWTRNKSRYSTRIKDITKDF